MATTILFRRAQASRRLSGQPGLPRRAGYRRQAGDRPVTLLTTLAVGALAGMMFAPAGGTAFASFDSPAIAAAGARTTPKTSRLPKATTVPAARTRPEMTAAPSACTPPASPIHKGPIAYV